MKRSLIIAALFCVALSAFAIEFTIAPIYYVDETRERVFPQNNFQQRILNELGLVSTNMEVQFKNTISSRYNPPQSVGDAIIMCRAEEADYLVYGYITEKDYTIQGELRILDYRRKEVIATFYAMDAKDREDALVNDLVTKLFRYVQETYNIKIITDPPSFTHIQIPVSLGYWLPIDREWIGMLYGIVRINGGIQIIPKDIVTIVAGKLYYISVGVDISYRLGKGRNYDAWDHDFTISTPVLFHRKYNEQHEAFAGFGLLYSINLLHIKKPYEDPTTETYNALGVMLGGGWSFHFRENLFLFADGRIELRFYENPMVSFTPSFGIILRRHTQEVVKKW